MSHHIFNCEVTLKPLALKKSYYFLYHYEDIVNGQHDHIMHARLHA